MELDLGVFWAQLQSVVVLETFRKKTQTQEFVHISALCVTCQALKENNFFVSCGCIKVSICSSAQKKKLQTSPQRTCGPWNISPLKCMLSQRMLICLLLHWWGFVQRLWILLSSSFLNDAFTLGGSRFITTSRIQSICSD